MAKKRSAKADSKQTLELSLPDELYEKAKELAEKDPETLRSIMKSILGGDSRFGVDQVAISRRDSAERNREQLKFYKPC